MSRHRLNPRSLRYRVLLLVVAIVVLPLIWVWGSGISESSEVRTLQRELAGAVQEVADGADPALVADEQRLRIRVLRADGTIETDADHAERRWRTDLGPSLMWGPEGSPHLAEVDDELGVLAQRAEVRAATAKAIASCEVLSGDRLLVCTATLKRPDGRVIHAMAGSRRLVRSLYEERFQLAALTSVVLAVGILLALWIGYRMVRPIESLRDQVVARAGGRASTAPVVLDREDELGDLASAFNQLLSSLDHRNQSNAAFAADLAHELKNPVAAVRAAAEAMSSDRPVDGHRKERLQRVLADASSRMEAVVDRFLELARAEAGLQGADREPVGLRALCKAVVVPVTADDRYRELSITVDGPEAVVAAVPERLETALRNLIHNAAAFAAPSGRVSVVVASTGESHRVTVTDSGPGIPEGDLPKVFDRYFTTREGGTGLGLALTKAIIEAHGGTIEAASPGGARFTISLPANPLPNA